jgi:hypothetical protein
LAAQDADFDLHHVEPAGVLGRVVELQPAQHAARFGGRKGLVQRAGRICRQIVQDDAGAFRFRELDITELAHAGGEVHGGLALALLIASTGAPQAAGCRAILWRRKSCQDARTSSWS